MTPSLAQQTIAKLEPLRPRWYAAKESVGIDILHALQGEEGDDFGGLFALLQASEGERERLVAANGELRRELSYEGDQRERAEKAEAALQASERERERLTTALTKIADDPLDEPATWGGAAEWMRRIANATLGRKHPR